MDQVSEPGKIRGIRVPLGGNNYIIPPLNLIGFEQHEAEVEKLSADANLKVSEKLKIICGIALSAIQRNYPEVTMDFLKQWIDLGNMQEVFMAVMAQSGMRAAKPGEVMAGASSGPPSTPVLPLSPDGNGATSVSH